MKLLELFKHAFATASDQLKPEEKLELDKLAEQINKSGIKTPFCLFLESMKPLSYIGSQAVLGMQPFLELLIPKEKIEITISILSKREAVDYLLKTIK